MAIDLEALRRKVAQLKGEDKKSGNLFKPALTGNETSKLYEVRILPLTKGDTSTPCREIWFYPWDIVNGPIPNLKQRGQPDPIEELIQLLRKDWDANRETLKKLYPKMSAFANVIVRGQEDKGVQQWKLTKTQYERVLNLILDEDNGDITDPQEGRDLKVLIEVEPGKFFNNKPSTKLTIDARGKVTPLSTDKALAKKWLDSCPDPMDSVEFKTYDEISTLVQKWLASPVPGSTSSEETRGGASNVKQESTPAVEKVTPKPKKSAPVASAAAEDLDEAFADLEKDMA